MLAGGVEAANVTYTPPTGGTVAATNMQDAITELASETQAAMAALTTSTNTALTNAIAATNRTSARLFYLGNL